MLHVHQIDIRVRYQETDAQGHVHHASYFTYFELARTEMLRASHRGYESMEADGLCLVVAEISCRYVRSCRFGDVITVKIETTRCKGARIEHAYTVLLDGQLLAEGRSTVACTDQRGAVRRLPTWMFAE